MLVHEAHSVLPERAWRERQRNLSAANLKVAPRIRRVKARQDLDQRRLPRTVLAEKAMHLAGSDFERSPIEGLLAPEGLAQVPKPKRGPMACSFY
jgi:hypothetical protein